MKNDLTALPWRTGQLHMVENYWEAAGVLCAIRGGIAPESVRRPLAQTRVTTRELNDAKSEQLPAERAKLFG